MNTEELKRLAAPLVKWGADSAWENPSWTAAVGYIDEDGNRDPILTVDTTIYDGFEGDSLELANFYAAANPAAILALIQQRDELLAALRESQLVNFWVSCQSGVVERCQCAGCIDVRIQGAIAKAEAQS